MKKNNHNTCVVYLLNDIDRHFHLTEIFLACLKINMKHSQNIDVETCRFRPVTSQCTKWWFPTTAMCVKTVSSNGTFGYIGCQRTVSPVLMGRNFSSVDILLTFTLCQCNVITLLNNLSGTGARSPFCTCHDSLWCQNILTSQAVVACAKLVTRLDHYVASKIQQHLYNNCIMIFSTIWEITQKR